MSIKELYEIRNYRPEDKAFIMATFLRGIYYGNKLYGCIPKEVFMDVYTKIGNDLLERGVIQVAALKEDTNTVLGYSILSPDFQAIHWVFVKKPWRGNGIAKSLVPQFPSYVTHMTDSTASALRLTDDKHRRFEKLNNAVYNPFLL